MIDPVMHPGPASIDLEAYGIAHRDPFLLELTIDARHMSSVIEHVSNIEYVRWLDRAAELHADALGYTRRQLETDGVMWFIARHEIDYLAETHLGETLVVATWVRNFKRVKSWRDYCIVRPHDGTVVCRAATLWVLVDLASRRPTRIPDEMIERFAPLESRPERGGVRPGSE